MSTPPTKTPVTEQEQLQALREKFHEQHQKEREVLFGNERFLIGVLQVVSGGSLFAGIAQTEALEKLAGTLPFLVFITLMAGALVAAVLAAYWKHEYKKWDVKGGASAAQGKQSEADQRSDKASRCLVAMRGAMQVCLLLLIFGFTELLGFAWYTLLKPR